MTKIDVTSGGTMVGRLEGRDNVVDPSTGSAPFRLTAKLDGVHTVGLFLNPIIGGGTRRDSFPAACALKLGTHGRPIPAGAAGAFCGYEANLDTAQRHEDLPAREAGHAFGATIWVSGGAHYDAVDTVLRIVATPADTNGIVFCLQKEVTGGYQSGVTVNSTGPLPGTVGVLVTGNWEHGIDLQGHDLIGATAVGLENGAMIADSVEGLLFFSASQPGQRRAIYFLDNPYDRNVVLAVDTDKRRVWVDGRWL